MILTLQIAVGVFVGYVGGQVLLTTVSFYMGRHYAMKRRAEEEATVKILREAAARAPKTEEEKKDVGQYL
jgi:5-formaminoimidazole-4-carboxamide-1-beta-D-ribofuranosyl 5'-monophosphate synthetase